MLSQEMKKTSGEILDSSARFCCDDSLDYLVTVVLKDVYLEQSLKLQCPTRQYTGQEWEQWLLAQMISI